MLDWIYEAPGWFVGSLFALGSVALSLGGMLLVRPIFHRLIHGQDRINEMVSLNIASFSLFYGIMLGLVAVGVFADFESTRDVIEREASTLTALYSDAKALPEPGRTQLLTDLREYARFTIEKDWPQQIEGRVPRDGTQRLSLFQTHLLAVHTWSKSDEIAYAEAFGQFQKLVELRSSRLDRVTSEMPVILWVVIIIGAMLTILVIWMLDMEIHVHGILTAVLSLFLGIVFFYIAVMDKPFRGAPLLTPEPYEMAYRALIAEPIVARAQPAADVSPVTAPVRAGAYETRDPTFDPQADRERRFRSTGFH